jgi:predicted dehydrogenase
VYNIGVIGCGPMGRMIGAAWQLLPDASVAALCDIDEERLNAIGEELGVAPAKRYRSIDEMLSREELDIVIVATQTDLHAPLTLPVLEAAIHAVGEKPMDDDLDGAHAMMEAATKNGARLAIHHQGRIAPCDRELQHRIAQGDIGQVVEVHFGGKGYYGGYGLLNIGTHALNSLRGFVNSEFDWVHGRLETGGRPTQPEDIIIAPNHFGVIAGEHVILECRFKDGTRATLSLNRHNPSHSHNSFTHIRGTEGQFYVGYDSSKYFFSRDTRYGPWVEWEAVRMPYERYPIEGIDQEHPALRRGEVYFAREMIDAIEEGREHTCSGREGLKIMQLMMGCFISHFEGRRVSLPLEERGHPLVRIREEAGLGPVDTDVPMPLGEWLEHELQRMKAAGLNPYGIVGVK